MNPLEQDFENKCAASRAKNFGFNVKDALAILVKLTGDWFFRYGQQQSGDRESDMQARAKQDAKMKDLESRLFKLENKGDGA